MDEATKKALEDIDSTNKLLKQLDGATGINILLEQTEAATARLRDISFPNIQPYRPSFPEIEFQTQEQINEYQSASVLMEALAKEALEWKENLPENFRPAILALLHSGVQINVHSLSQVTFHGIRIEGSMNDALCSLFAHQSTVQILCYAEEITPENPKRPIGFIWDNNHVEV